jgi:hypothetical protein
MALALAQYENLFYLVRGYPYGANGEKQTVDPWDWLYHTD